MESMGGAGSLESLEAELNLHSEICSLTETCFRKCVKPSSVASGSGSDMLSDGQALCVYNCFFRTMDVFHTVGSLVLSQAQGQQE